MCVCKRPAACLRKCPKLLGAEQRQVDRALAVPELAHVVILLLPVLAGQPAPTQQHVADRLHVLSKRGEVHAAIAAQVAMVGDVNVQGGRQREGAHALKEAHAKRPGPRAASPHIVEHVSLASVIGASVGIVPSEFSSPPETAPSSSSLSSYPSALASASKSSGVLHANALAFCSSVKSLNSALGSPLEYGALSRLRAFQVMLWVEFYYIWLEDSY